MSELQTRLRDWAEQWGVDADTPDHAVVNESRMARDCARSADALDAQAQEIAALRARLADAERDAERFRYMAVDEAGAPFCDEWGDMDLHEQAAIYASARGNDEPDRDDYLAAMRDAADAARGGA